MPGPLRGLRYETPAFYRPRCEHRIDPNLQPQEYEWRVRRRERNPGSYPLPIEQCTRHSRYRINGVNFCTQHAGKAVLDALFPPTMEGELNDRVR